MEHLCLHHVNGRNIGNFLIATHNFGQLECCAGKIFLTIFYLSVQWLEMNLKGSVKFHFSGVVEIFFRGCLELWSA